MEFVKETQTCKNSVGEFEMKKIAGHMIKSFKVSGTTGMRDT
jgi:hypothetical protein